MNVDRWQTENQEITKKHREWVVEKAKHDEKYYMMEGKYEGMKKSLIDKDEWIVKISKELEKKVRELEKAKKINTNYKRRRILGNSIFLNSFIDLEKIIDEKDLEIRVLNQMIVSANKMVQVKSTEFKRIKNKFDNQSKIFSVMRETLDPRDSQIVRIHPQKQIKKFYPWKTQPALLFFFDQICLKSKKIIF